MSRLGSSCQSGLGPVRLGLRAIGRSLDFIPRLSKGFEQYENLTEAVGSEGLVCVLEGQYCHWQH